MLTARTGDPEMSREEFELIRDFIHARSGLYFADNKQYLLQSRLRGRLSELSIKSYRDYFYHVKYDSSRREFRQLMNIMTTNETSFFRTEPQLLSLGSEVLPQIMADKENRRLPRLLRVWSAGCSTGEEPYTLAMILLDALRHKPGWKVEVIANDISEDVLQSARRGEYQGHTLRNIKPLTLQRHFDRSGDIYTVKREVKALVKFGLLNLNDERTLSLNTNFDIVFCRNVMIYFSSDVKKRIVRGFFNALRPGGYFYIGHSETLHGVSKAFSPVYCRNSLVYRKEVIGAAQQTATPGRKSISSATGAWQPATALKTEAASK